MAQPPLKPSDVMPSAELKSAAVVDPNRCEPQALMEGHAWLVRQDDPGESVAITQLREPLEQPRRALPEGVRPGARERGE